MCFAGILQRADAEQKPVSVSKELRLIAIDSMVMDGYYLLTFQDGKQRYQVLSSKRLQSRVGCWESISIGKRYIINIVGDAGYYTDAGVYFSTHLRGLIIIDDKDTANIKRTTILKPDEFFYTTDDINGLLVRQAK